MGCKSSKYASATEPPPNGKAEPVAQIVPTANPVTMPESETPAPPSAQSDAAAPVQSAEPAVAAASEVSPSNPSAEGETVTEKPRATVAFRDGIARERSTESLGKPASELGEESRGTAVEVVAALQAGPNDTVEPKAVKLQVDRVMKRSESKSSLLLAKVARSRYQSSMMRVTGDLAPTAKVMTPAKSRRELNRMASISIGRVTSAEGTSPVPVTTPEPTTGPSAEALARYVGTWRGGAVEGRDEFLKAMELPWLVRKVASMLPNFDMVFFVDEEGVLRSHASTLGKVVEESYSEGGQSTKTFKGITTTVTYHWEGDILTYTVQKESAPQEEAKSRRWIEPNGNTMRAESHFRKDPSKPWAVLYRTWTRAEDA